jgi:hypothetical protein
MTCPMRLIDPCPVALLCMHGVLCLRGLTRVASVRPRRAEHGPTPKQPAHNAKSLESEETSLRLAKSLETIQIPHPLQNLQNLEGSEFRGFPPLCKLVEIAGKQSL